VYTPKQEALSPGEISLCDTVDVEELAEKKAD
jgi:hypothetical protein